MEFQSCNLHSNMLRDLSSVFHIFDDYFAWVMSCHIEFLKTFALKVSNLVRKKTKKKAID